MSILTLLPFSVGVIEGFYGRAWSFGQRQQLIRFLSNEGFSHYCYAPKSDPYLRKRWTSLWPKSLFDALIALRQCCAEHGVGFGVGLSPYALYTQWNRSGRQALMQRLQQIQSLSIDHLALLFDDMPGNWPMLADIQVEIAHFITEHLPEVRLTFCPTYYSYDAVLEDVFGPMPDQYWSTLGDQLHRSIDVFWTGNRVVSKLYSPSDFVAITRQFKRKPALWDNSCVNDGRKTSAYIPWRDPIPLVPLASHISSLWVNPMSQLQAAMVNLYALAHHMPIKQALEACHRQHAAVLCNILPLLEKIGVDKLSKEQKKQLLTLWSPYQEELLFKELLAWLAGDYAFDPACLND